jgi:hypothetical protein
VQQTTLSVSRVTLRGTSTVTQKRSAQSRHQGGSAPFRARLGPAD